jgi:hypothetical protein
MLLLVHLHTIVTSALYYVWSNDTVIHELERMWKEVVIVYFEQYTDIWLKGLKCHKNQIEISRCEAESTIANPFIKMFATLEYHLPFRLLITEFIRIDVTICTLS